MDQLLAARHAPELEGIGFGWRVGIGKQLHHGIMIGEPGRVRVARIQSGIFQQAQAPSLRRVPATTAQPVAAVAGVSAQVFPSQRGAVQV